MTTPSLRDEIGEVLWAYQMDHLCTLDAEEQIMAMIDRHTAPLREAIRAADELRKAADDVVPLGGCNCRQTTICDSCEFYLSQKNFDTARRAVGEVGQ